MWGVGVDKLINVNKVRGVSLSTVFYHFYIYIYISYRPKKTRTQNYLNFVPLHLNQIPDFMLNAPATRKRERETISSLRTIKKTQKIIIVFLYIRCQMLQEKMGVFHLESSSKCNCKTSPKVPTLLMARALGNRLLRRKETYQELQVKSWPTGVQAKYFYFLLILWIDLSSLCHSLDECVFQKLH